MSSISFPSQAFPGPPGVSFEIPEGWEPVHAPGIVMAVRQRREGAFSPNVVVTIEQCPPDYDLEISLNQIRTMAAERQGEASEPFEADLGGAMFVGCDATWPDADVENILQANLFHIVPPRGATPAAYLVQLTGAVAGDDAESDYEVVRGIMMTTKLNLGDFPQEPLAPAGAATSPDAAAPATEGAGTSE